MYLIGQGPVRTLVDAGSGHESTMHQFSSWAQSQRIKVDTVLLTHAHKNHTRGLPMISSLLLKDAKIMKIPLGKDAIPGVHALKDGQMIVRNADQDKNSLRVIHTPGHASDHACFHLLEEDALISGDAITTKAYSSGSRLTESDAAFENLEEYLRSLSKLQQIFPKLVFPGHGYLIVNPIQMLDMARDCQSRISTQLHRQLTVSGRNPLSTGRLIELFFKENKIENENDRFLLQGTIRLHLLRLEQQGLIKRVPGIKDPMDTGSHKSDPAKIKGPGGLNMAQIFGSIQESRRRDWESVKGLDRIRSPFSRDQLHPIHASVQLSAHVHWSPLS